MSEQAGASQRIGIRERHSNKHEERKATLGNSGRRKGKVVSPQQGALRIERSKWVINWWVCK